MNLLIVDDEKVNAVTIKEKIEWDKYGITNVFTAFDAEAAKRCIKEENIDILLTDIEMPGDDGVMLLKWVREKAYDMECIFMTCHAKFTYAQEAVKLGCRDYILMPARFEEIADAVVRTVESRKKKIENLQLEKYGKSWIQKKQEEVIYNDQAKGKPRMIVEQCCNFILENLENTELSVNMAAAHFNLNAIYLNRIFKQIKGTSISQYIISEKMELAASLLRTPEINASSVAEKVGYLNYPFFSTTFKKYFGCSPKQYMKDIEDQKV